MFHLFTHAFFKALLFLSAGAVIHSMHHEQDMRKMGGLAKYIPFTWAMMLIGNLALTGVGIPVLGIGTSGFYSKDGIINAAFLSGGGMGQYAFWLTLIAAGMTAFYSWRQFLMTFHGPYRPDQSPHGHDDHATDEDAHHAAVKLSEVHESPLTMLIPLALLAAGALFAGAAFNPVFVGIDAGGFWRTSLGAITGHHGAEAEVPMWVELAPIILTIIGFGIAYYYYVLHPDLPPKMAAKKGLLYTFFYNKWYFDELYDFLFVRPTMWIGRTLWKVGDGKIIDGLGPDGIAARVLDVTRETVRIQSGYVYHYALAMLAGALVLITWFMVMGGAL
jgi:NADH-quinone oxidoreductase subunit L